MSLHLEIATPTRVLTKTGDVRSLRASDHSGSFGILPGHEDFITVLPASIVAWREASSTEWRFCAVRGGVLAVSDGREVSVACRQAVFGRDLAGLEAQVREAGLRHTEANRSARAEQIRLHAQAVRQLVKYLQPRRVNSGFPRTSGGEV